MPLWHRKVAISIHAPREGGDVLLPGNPGIHEPISIHAPREGGDVCGLEMFRLR